MCTSGGLAHWGHDCNLWVCRQLPLAEGLLFIEDVKPIIAIALPVLLVGCAVEEPVGYGDDLGTTENPIPSEETYEVASRVQISLEMPTAVANLRAFAQAGGRTLLNRSGSAPAWIATLPLSLRTGLEGYIDAELDKVKHATKTLRQVTGEIATISETALRTFTIESSLWITPTSVQHSLIDLNFTPASIDIVIPIGGLKADTIAQRPTADVGPGGALTVGDHAFSLAFGSHAWQAINLASTTLFGADLSLLTNLDCGTVARAVAAKCISGSCVGHASELESACKSGVSALVEDLRTQVTPIALDVVLASGTARLVDDGFDGIADRIVDGTWDAETDTGSGARKATATFLAY